AALFIRLEIEALELLLAHAVHALYFLLLAQLLAVLGSAPRAAVRPVLSGRSVQPALQALSAGRAQVPPLRSFARVLRSSITSHSTTSPCISTPLRRAAQQAAELSLCGLFPLPMPRVSRPARAPYCTRGIAGWQCFWSFSVHFIYFWRCRKACSPPRGYKK